MSPRRTFLCLAVVFVCIVAALTVDACAASQPTPTNHARSGIRVTTPLMGVSVLSSAGHSYRQARRAADKRYGGLRVVRYFDPNTPNPWRVIRRDVGRRPIVTSFRATPADVLSGRQDSLFRHWFGQAPLRRITWWSYLPEPEDDIAGGAYPASDYRAAFAHLSQLASTAGNPNLRSTLILMCYTLSQFSGRDWRDYYAGSADVDVMGWDCYNDRAPRGVYESPREIFHAAVRLSRRLGKPWGIAETGSPLVGKDTGSHRAAWLRHVGRYARRHHAQFATYFDINWGSVDYRLTDRRSRVAWRAVVKDGSH
jgi:hypothetical protein